MFHRFHCKSIQSVALDARSGELAMVFQYEPDRGKVSIRLARDVAERLANFIRKELEAGADGQPEERPRIVRDATAVTLPSGEVWVGLAVEGSEEPLVISPGVIAQIQNVLAKPHV
jgi:hypothetical protein